MALGITQTEPRSSTSYAHSVPSFSPCDLGYTVIYLAKLHRRNYTGVDRAVESGTEVVVGPWTVPPLPWRPQSTDPASSTPIFALRRRLAGSL